ncbi:MAG: N-carbamoylputrescine amidase [Erysipelotrichaceae bacterium]
MSKIKVAAVQMSCNDSQTENLKKAEDYLTTAAQNGAKIILLPELFDRVYFCQEKRYEYYDYALALNDHPSVKMAVRLAKQYEVVIPVSFYEKDGNSLYNSVACVDADGKILGVYRKTHIPDDHFYQEKFYFTPGNSGFRVFDSKYGKIGVGICWDQWFSETARILTLNGADILLFPTAIGSEPILSTDSQPHWQRVMQGHAAANIIPVVAANRVGLETVKPCRENNNQSSSLEFYGSSFICDATGELIQKADRTEQTVIYAEFDFEAIKQQRFEWGLFRDRREECYGKIIGKWSCKKINNSNKYKIKP